MTDPTTVGPVTIDPAIVDRLKIDPVKVIETVTFVAPLGLRFWDDVSGKFIGDGLVVTAYPEGNPSRRVPAFSNSSGIYIPRKLPGLRDFENGKGDEAFWDFWKQKSKIPFVIEVEDTEGRFQPFLLTIGLPVRSLFVWEDLLSPPTASPGVPLYSTPNRSVPAGMAVLHADLWDPWGGLKHTGGPAAWAVIEARIHGKLIARGVADEKGRIALIFAYPEPVTDTLGSPPGFSLTSPPGPTGPSLREQEWSIELDAAYGRLRAVPPLRDMRSIPKLHDVLSQPPATLWADSERTRPLVEQTLKFGQELIVRSEAENFTSPPRVKPMSELFITPAESLP